MADDTFTSGDIATAEKSSAAASPAPQTPAPETTPPAATVPAGTPETAAADKHGPVPFERHEAVLSSTRREYDEKLSRLSWAERLDAERVTRALALQELYENDADGLYEALSKRRAPVSAEPQPDSKSAETGELFYSPQQAAKWAVWEANRIVDERMKELDQRLGPIESERAQTKRTEGYIAQIDEAQTWKGFSENIEAVTAALAAAKEAGKPISLKDAYIQVVVPTLGVTEADLRKTLEPEIRKAILAEINSTTQRATSDLNPTRMPAGERKANKDRSLKDLVSETAQELSAAR